MLGPIFSIELVTASRRVRYFVVRVLYGLVLLIALGMVHHECFRWGDPRDIGDVARFAAAFFGTFTVLQLLAVFFLTPAMAAGTIALERERRTIEYLFVSHLTNLQIVFGKLAARLVQIFCLILVGLPILSLAGLMGGIAPEALLVAFLMILSSVVFAATLSIALSVWSVRARDAVMRAYLVLFCVLVVPPVADAAARGTWLYGALFEPLNGQLLVANPFWLLACEILSEAASADASRAWEMLLAMLRNHGLVAAACLAAATLAVRRVHLRARGEGASQRRFRLMHLVRPRCGAHPMLWKEVFAEPGLGRLGIVGRIAAALIALTVIGVALYQFAETTGSRGWRGDPEWFLAFTSMMTGAVGTGGLILVGARAAATVTGERERECWDSLLSTPLAPGEIVAAKLLGSLSAIRGVFFLLGFLWLLALLIDPGFLAAEVFFLGTFLLLAFAVASMGVLYSLWCRNSMRAMAATIATGAVVGGGYLFCCFPAFAGPGDDAAQVLLAPCVPFLIVFPGIVYSEGENILRHEPTIVVAYLLGVIGYATAGVLLLSGAIGNFEELNGRTGGTAPYRPRRRPIAPPDEYVKAEIIEEDFPKQ